MLFGEHAKTSIAGMNRNQALAFVIAAANVAFILLFPPFDAYSIASAQLPVFAGFNFYFSRDQFMVVNTGVLNLELFVVLINACIAALLLRTGRTDGARGRVSLQNATLIVVAFNLVLVMLFPPFESVYAITRAAIPTFEGFFFIFARQSNHVIVSTILYLEVVFILVNGALLWLMFRKKNPAALSPEEAYKVMMEMRKSDG
jgi:hypothetical protein